jgi:hypothetical protein
MAWWTIQIVLAHSIVWGLTGAFDTLTPAVLGLMGISAGTTVGSALIDAQGRTVADEDQATLREALAKKAARLPELEAELAVARRLRDALAAVKPSDVLADLTKAVVAAAARPEAVRLADLGDRMKAASPDVHAVMLAGASNDAKRDVERLELATRTVARARDDLARRSAWLPERYVPKSDNPVVDILTGNDGIALHRVQMVLWTLLLSGYFWACVWRGLEMPDFDAAWLGLMGISGGTYLGFKFPERR